MLYKHTKDKINPFIENFKQELEKSKKELGRELSAKGLYDSGVRFIKTEDLFLELIEKLIIKTKEILYNEIKNDKIKKPDFLEIKSTIKKTVDHLIENFKDDIKKEKLSKAFNEAEFKQKVKNLIERLFVDMEQEFDNI